MLHGVVAPFRPVFTRFLYAGMLLFSPLLAAQIPVSTSPLSELIYQPQREAPAQVIALEDSRISAEISAVITALIVDVGATVAQDDVLAELDCSDYDLQAQEHFLPILAHRYGYKVREVPLAQSKQDIYQKLYPMGVYSRRLLDLLSIFFLVKFTRKPLRFFGLTGLTSLLTGGVYTGYLVIQRLYMGVPLADRPALLLGLLLIVLGIQLFAIGLVGELIIFTHAREQREYTIEQIVN